MRAFVLLLVALLCAPVAAGAQSAASRAAMTSVGTETGLPIPRFVTLRAREVNVRTGPGVRYPIDWVFQRPNLPVEVVAEFDTWRKIRDFEGTEGWVHQSMLSGRRTVIVVTAVRLLRREPAESSPPMARLEPGVIAWLEACRGDWCEVEVAGIDGWLRRGDVWGVRADESIEE
ncbi:SH3 domain-containing protein [Thalassobaculum sp.]|jgi:SH3-like domain-containing protein|uniref:SH3 domain-containing protein n=1 Tax=Thalassobaculum sp. TaxID=2022740 RepID=UPI003B59B4D4